MNELRVGDVFFVWGSFVNLGIPVIVRQFGNLSNCDALPRRAAARRSGASVKSGVEGGRGADNGKGTSAAREAPFGARGGERPPRSREGASTNDEQRGLFVL